jgi:hypothetical protein
LLLVFALLVHFYLNRMGLHQSTPKMKCEFMKKEHQEGVYLKLLNASSDLPSWFPYAYFAFCSPVSGEEVQLNTTYVCISIVPDPDRDTHVNLILVPRSGEVVRVGIPKGNFITDALFEKPMSYTIVPIP